MSIKELLHKHWGIEIQELSTMAGYESVNFRIQSNHGNYVLKEYRGDQALYEVISAENVVLSSITTNSKIYPSVYKSKEGKVLIRDPKDPFKFYRLLSFLEGEFWGDRDDITADLLQSFGSFLANMDLQMKGLGPMAIRAKRIVWDLDQFLLNEPLIAQIDVAQQRKLVDYFFQQYKEHVLPQLPLLRKSLIHNDANDWNVLTTGNEVTGIIDFGDMVYSSLINELAVGLAYVLMGRTDPLYDAATVIGAYHKIHPLEETELDILYYLIAARLCTSVCNSAKTKKEQPDNSYITVSEQPAWDLLTQWISLSPIQASSLFRSACGYQTKTYDTSELDQKRHKHLSSALSMSYDRPIHMQSAAFQYMYDSEGHAILDAYNNIIHVGHCHPHVVSAGQRAMSRLNTNTRYHYDSLTSYAEHLLSYFPDRLNKVFFVNSGSAASDLAIRMARTYTGRDTVAVMRHGYHGNSTMGIDISHYKYAHKGGSGRQGHIIEAELPDAYRGKYRGPDAYRGKYRGPDAGSLYAREFIAENRSEPIGAFIAEPIVGCGGQVPLAPGYLEEIYPFIRSQGGVCISDEVQVGFGRVGTHFWGYEMHGVVPDIVVLGKPIGNGHPMAAVVCTTEIADAFDNGMEFFSSFGGNPVSCAIGKAVLEVIEQEQLQQHALDVGNYIMSGFKALQTKYPQIGDVRGSGLFIGIDMIQLDGDCKADTTLGHHLKNQLREQSILVSTDGPDNNVIKIKAPLCFNKSNADQLIEAFKKVLWDRLCANR